MVGQSSNKNGQKFKVKGDTWHDHIDHTIMMWQQQRVPHCTSYI
jgi:hypothetical protein